MLAPEGWPFVFGGAAFAIVVVLLWPRGIPLAALGLLFALFSLWFFRNPDRTPPPGPENADYPLCSPPETSCLLGTGGTWSTRRSSR